MEKAHLHLDLELVLQDTRKLLHVMLHERVKRLPAEGFGQFGGAYMSAVPTLKTDKLATKEIRTNRMGRGLQVIKDPL